MAKGKIRGVSVCRQTPVRRFGFKASAQRRVLLAGVSLGTVVVAGLTIPAAPAAAKPPLFSQAWVSQTAGVSPSSGSADAQAPSAAVGGAGGPILGLGQIQAKAQQQIADLARAAQAVTGAQAAQLAAQQAAQAAGATAARSNLAPVTDGLSANGLVVDPRVTSSNFSGSCISTSCLWTGANAPTQSTADGTTTVTITQTASRAVMTWQKFNVGSHTVVDFDQSGGNDATNGNSWVALNRIDATGSPSQILGSIKADGTVLLINPNGVIFGAGAQVNTHSLVVAAMDIGGSGGSTGAFTSAGAYVQIAGTNAFAPDAESSANASFIANGLYGINGTSFAAGVLPTGQTDVGVVVDKGASIAAAISGFGNGGLIALLGPSVTNAGSLTAPNGQVALGAADELYLAPPQSGAVATNTNPFAIAFTLSTSPPNSFSSLYTPSHPSYGAVVNDDSGLLLATDGNISLVGGSVSQQGTVAASTSVSRSGSILIQAVDTTAGSVTFGPQSVTALLPDADSQTVAAGSAGSFVLPVIKAQAATDMDIQGGALIEAPGASVTLTGSATQGSSTILFEPGSIIDLAGLADVPASIQDMLITLKITANEVADDPLARGLIGQTVTIDGQLGGTNADGRVWAGSPILDATGYVTDIPETVSELLTQGGKLTASGWINAVTAPGSLINISGGWIDVQGGMVKTTTLRSADGSITDIGSANPNIQYTGLAGEVTVDHSAWGVTTSFINPLMAHAGGTFQESYIDGGSAGSISISAFNPILQGNVVALTEAGTRQRAQAQTGTQVPGLQVGGDSLPSGGSLSISITNPAGAAVVLQDAADVSGLAGLNFNSASADDAFKPTGPLVYSTAQLSSFDLGSISISGAYTLSVAEGASLAVQPGGSITLTGVTTMDGTLSAPSGTISLTGYTGVGGISGPGALGMPATALVIGPDGRLDVAGLWVNDSGAASPDAAQGSAFVNGGTVSISTEALSSITGTDLGNGTAQVTVTDVTQSIVLSAGSVIDVSSGGYVGVNGALKLASDGLPLGSGGSLVLTTYAGGWTQTGTGTLGIVSTNGVTLGELEQTLNFSPTSAATNATLYLDGTILSEGFQHGGTCAGGVACGTLSLQAPSFQIGGSGVTSVISDAGNGELFLPTSFFTNNGFAHYNLTSTYGSIVVADGTTLTLQQSNFLPSGGAGTVLTAGSGTADKDEPTGSSPALFASVGILPDGLRQAVDLSLTENTLNLWAPSTDSSATQAGVVVGAGARIQADPGAAITLSALGGSVTVLGAINAPGGTVTLSAHPLATDSGSTESGSILPSYLWIGANAVIDVDGVFVPNPSVTAYSTGTVLGGGTITLDTTSTITPAAPLVVLAGAQFDIQGATGTIQVPDPASSANSAAFVRQSVWSDGGLLSIKAQGTMFFDGSIAAAAVAPGAAGGSLQVESGNLIIGQTGPTVPAGTVPPASRSALLRLPSAAFLSADLLQNSGLDSVTLNTDLAVSSTSSVGTIAFAGPVTLSVPDRLTLDAATLMVLPGGLDQATAANDAASPNGNQPASVGGAAVSLTAGYVSIQGNATKPSSLVFPHLSDGSLTVTATAQLDIGNVVSVANAANVSFISQGDIRFEGSTGSTSGSGSTPYGGALLVPSALYFTARQIYPETDTRFMIAARDLISVSSNGTPDAAPLSAGGALLLDATSIQQDGTLRAPLGTIEIGLSGAGDLPSIAAAFTPVLTQSVTLGAGSVTSVSADGLEIPFGYTTDGSVWYEGSAKNAPIEVTAPPAKSVQLNGVAVAIQSGATVDASGGGDAYASEFVSGTGGLRNVLTTAAAGETVYALVPAFGGKVAPTDPTFANVFGSAGPQAAQEVVLTGGGGIPAGTYLLLPGMYATLPGAYRVVELPGTAGATAAGNTTTADGTAYVAGYLLNGITGAHAAQDSVFEVQSKATWSQYSDVQVTSANSFFAAAAAHAGTAVPSLPQDAGQIVLSASASLDLSGSVDLTPATGGRGGQVDIAAADILVLASDKTVRSPGALVLDSDQLDALGATTLVLGGSLSQTASGEQLTPTATAIEVSTDADHPLSAPDLLLVTQGGGTGIKIDGGSVLQAVGTVPAGTAPPIQIGVAGGASGDGALLRLSQAGTAAVTRQNVTTTSGALIDIEDGAVLEGTNGGRAASLTLDSSSGMTLGRGLTLLASNYDFSASAINIGGGSGGLVINSALLSNLAGADSLTLTSASAINFYGSVQLGSAAAPIGSIVLDAAGLDSDGGTVSVSAGTVTLTDSKGGTAGGVSGAGGTLTVTASDLLDFSNGAQALNGFGAVSMSAGQQILFGGTGSLNAGSAAVALSAPGFALGTGSQYAVTTTGAVTLSAAAGTAPTVPVSQIGGSLSLTGASITDSAVLTALSGTVDFEATSGAVILQSGAKIIATGSAVPLFDQIQYAPGGIVRLVSDLGDVSVQSGSSIDVSAAGPGNAGSLVIEAGAQNQSATATATLQGSLTGTAAGGGQGGSFAVSTGILAGTLPGGFSGAVTVETRQGNLDIGDYADAVAQSLTAQSVTLVADGGLVRVDGTIDASGPAGGAIALYGGQGVTLDSTARLLATAKAVNSQDPVENGQSNLQAGGSIVLGTVGTPTGQFNADGSEQVSTASSGTITVAAGALLDVSGGIQAGLSGGTVTIRAPITTANSVNVSFAGTVTGAHAVTLDAFEVWSTTDATTGGQHFDGIVDPAGWFSSGGVKVAGTTSNGDVFNPTGALDQDHITFYQSTLAGFVQNPFDGNAAGVAALFSSVGSGLLHLSPEIDLVNPSTAINGGQITVASNWNLGAGSGAGNTAGDTHLVYRTTGPVDPGEPGVLTLRAVGGVALNASIGDGFFTPEIAGYVTPADAIANNPGADSTGALVLNTTTSGNLMPATLGGSFSYNFVAGADLGSADPSLAVAQGGGDITINGHTSFAGTDPVIDTNSGQTVLPVINIPTVLRTGTGSIDLTAAGNVAFTDTTVSGAVYSAGAAVATPADFSMTAGTGGGNGVVSTPAWGNGGGAVTVTAGNSIIGIEVTTDADGSETGFKGAMTAEMWTAWYYHASQSNGSSTTPFAGGTQSAAWVNYASFFQGFGALGGGNMRLTAGGDIRDVSASLPETMLVSGGTSLADPEILHLYGGGNLTVAAGGSLYSSDFYVGRGTGSITVGGAVAADAAYPVANSGGLYSGTTIALPLLLAVQDGTISVTARGSVTLGDILDPAELPVSLESVPLTAIADSATLGRQFQSFGQASGISMTSLTGDLVMETLSTDPTGAVSVGLFSPNGFNNVSHTKPTLTAWLPATLSADAVSGSVIFDNGGQMVPSATGTLSILAGESVDFSGHFFNGTTTAAGTDLLTMIDAVSEAGALGLPNSTNPTQDLHADDPVPVYIYAGLDIDNSSQANAGGTGHSVNSFRITVTKQARIEAGRDILSLALIGQNNNPDDVTSLIAGRDIVGAVDPIAPINPAIGVPGPSGNLVTLYGPGTLYVQAGRDLGPFQSAAASGGTSSAGIVAAGDGSNLFNVNGTAITIGANPTKAYLPDQAAQIIALFGVGPGIDYASAIKDYVDPASAGTGGITFLGSIAAQLGMTPAQAWTTFQGLSAQAQDILVDRAFLAFLTQVSADYNVVSSPYYRQYDRAYQAIQTLFPASLGYTKDNLVTGAGNGAIGGRVTTGNLNLAYSVIETQEPSNGIFIIGPGGGITVGSNGTDKLSPLQEGIQTLEGGSIGIFTDGTVALQQSRIMTAQGGDIDIFSANGDIIAGAAPKTVQSVPPVQLICDADGYCRINPAGLISGGGIAALLTLPGQDPDLSNVSLTAPVGTVDFGAAGVRAAGNLTVNALHVLNAFNVQVGGTAIGIPSAPSVNVGALAAANAAASAAGQPAAALANQRVAEVVTPAIITVEVLGFGEPSAQQQQQLMQPQ